MIKHSFISGLSLPFRQALPTNPGSKRERTNAFWALLVMAEPGRGACMHEGPSSLSGILSFRVLRKGKASSSWCCRSAPLPHSSQGPSRWIPPPHSMPVPLRGARSSSLSLGSSFPFRLATPPSLAREPSRRLVFRRVLVRHPFSSPGSPKTYIIILSFPLSPLSSVLHPGDPAHLTRDRPDPDVHLVRHVLASSERASGVLTF